MNNYGKQLLETFSDSPEAERFDQLKAKK
jgi:hypothetical protein